MNGHRNCRVVNFSDKRVDQGKKLLFETSSGVDVGQRWRELGLVESEEDPVKVVNDTPPEKGRKETVPFVVDETTSLERGCVVLDVEVYSDAFENRGQFR
jgi:hypothetical protein